MKVFIVFLYYPSDICRIYHGITSLMSDFYNLYLVPLFWSVCPDAYELYFILFWDRVSFCCPGWSAVAWSLRSLQPPMPWIKQFSCFSLLSSWDYRHAPLHPAKFCIFSRDGVLQFWPGWSRSPELVIRPPQPPKVLGLQAWATTPSLVFQNCISFASSFACVCKLCIKVSMLAFRWGCLVVWGREWVMG